MPYYQRSDTQKANKGPLCVNHIHKDKRYHDKCGRHVLCFHSAQCASVCLPSTYQQRGAQLIAYDAYIVAAVCAPRAIQLNIRIGKTHERRYFRPCESFRQVRTRNVLVHILHMNAAYGCPSLSQDAPWPGPWHGQHSRWFWVGSFVSYHRTNTNCRRL